MATLTRCLLLACLVSMGCDDTAYSRSGSVVHDSGPSGDEAPNQGSPERPVPPAGPDTPQPQEDPLPRCGGPQGLACPDDAWCSFAAETPCGRREAFGFCVPRPQGCDGEFQPVCGCDGLTHSNSCTAHSAGTPVAFEGPCETAPDTAPAVTGCEPMDATFAICGDLCDVPPRHVWNGESCTAAESCSCQGQDCGATYATAADCADAHRHCDPEICRATAGRWLSVPPHQMCGHYVCGHAPPEDCLTPVAGCDCGPGQTFVHGAGCVRDPQCTRDDLCLATGGALAACDLDCGRLTGDLCEGGGCDCGPAALFDDVRGCVFECPDIPRELCEQTGGRWEGNCGAFRCGEPSDNDCDGVECNCGRWSNFVPGRGCTRDDACLLRREGESCSRNGAIQDCGPSLVCCHTPSGGQCAVPCCGADCDPVSGCSLEGDGD